MPSRNNSPKRRCPFFETKKSPPIRAAIFLRFYLNFNVKIALHIATLCPLKTSVHLRLSFKCCRSKAGSALFSEGVCRFFF